MPGLSYAQLLSNSSQASQLNELPAFPSELESCAVLGQSGRYAQGFLLPSSRRVQPPGDLAS